MFELVVLLLVAILGVFVFLSLSGSAPQIEEPAAVAKPAAAQKSKDRASSSKSNDSKRSASYSPSTAEYKKAQGRTIASLGMEADVMHLTTTEDREAAAEKRRQKEAKIRREKEAAARAEAIANGEVEDHRAKKAAAKKEEAAEKYDPQLELAKERKAMNSRINKFVNSTVNNRKKQGKSSGEGVGSGATLKVLGGGSAAAAPWKHE